MNSAIPDYYAILEVDSNAQQDEIRLAYRKASLKCHPDRLGDATPAQKDKAKEEFQAVADAYYVLSDPVRRKEYDSLRRSRGAGAGSTNPQASASFFSEFANMFSGAGQSTPGSGMEPGQGRGGTQRPDAEGMFGDVFEELLRPEVERHIPLWAWLGALCGAGLGFIIANVPGLLVGIIAGNRLGAIRDAKGKSVAAVFNSLGGNQKAEILRTLAMKVLGTASTF